LGDRRIDKAKILMLGFILVLIVILGAYGIYEITSVPKPGEGYLRINKVAYCATDPNDASYSKNPPYFVGEKYYWWIHTTVSANANVSDAVVFDQLGGEFMIEGVSFVPIEKPGPYNYTFEYDAYESGANVSIIDRESVWTGYLDEAGVTFGDFVVYWTDETLKADFEWNIGSMKEGDVKEIYLTISTDTNPDGQQEFTSPGTYLLSSGATVEGIVESTGKHTSAESNYLEIEVLEKTEQ
jgi:hypothetical protein